MTPSGYLVIRSGDAWAIESGNRSFGPFPNMFTRPTPLDFAEKDGKAGRPAKVVAREDGGALRTVWTYGRD